MHVDSKQSMNPLLIYGAGGHAKCVIETALACGQKVGAILDDHPHAETVLGVPVLRTDSFAPADLRYYRFIIAIGDCSIRCEKFDWLCNLGATPETLIHPRANVSSSANIGRGSVLFALSHLDPCVTVGDNCIVNVGALIGHDSIVEDDCHISANACVGGACHIGRGAWISLGASIKEGVQIGAGAFVGLGAMVSHDVPANCNAISPHRREAAIRCRQSVATIVTDSK